VTRDCGRAPRLVVVRVARWQQASGGQSGRFSLKRNDKHWTLEEELAGKQEPTQVGRLLANLGVEKRYALSAPAKGSVDRLWGVLQDRLISELRNRHY